MTTTNVNRESPSTTSPAWKMLRPASCATDAVMASRPGKPAVLTISGLAESRWPVCRTSLVARHVPSSSKRTNPVGAARTLTANRETPSSPTRAIRSAREAEADSRRKEIGA